MLISKLVVLIFIILNINCLFNATLLNVTWLQLILETTHAKAELWSEALSNAGALAVTLQDAKENPLYEPPPGSTPLWDETRVIGLFNANVDLKFLNAYIQEQLGEEALNSMKIEALEDQNWERTCQAHFHPMQFGQRLWVCPTWETLPDPKAINIVLNPGLAFGTGTHPTTHLCLEWLDENPPINNIVIDYGCGSGILGIAALKLGAKKVYAVDHDIQALQSTQENARQNGYSDEIIGLSPEQLQETFLESSTLTVTHKADLILANILANPLKELAPQFAKLVKFKGTIVLSGILENQVEEVLQAYHPWFQEKDISILDEWCRISLVLMQHNSLLTI